MVLTGPLVKVVLSGQRDRAETAMWAVVHALEAQGYVHDSLKDAHHDNGVRTYTMLFTAGGRRGVPPKGQARLEGTP